MEIGQCCEMTYVNRDNGNFIFQKKDNNLECLSEDVLFGTSILVTSTKYDVVRKRSNAYLVHPRKE